ncbi:tRNA pseudouridine synthase B [Sulfurivirga caldicuralii]|uniref:tRNA pseudouridine synthase B n=1 Tax=Sulfurivirga caldicuralii TaxID=364032 RepID=A0A1N6FGM1_9GAMM|nr:tRNA pseudouridine(55) synthase TruB [Sulfurivirga caldicuralii]SIN94423.1 tRNA pseudouridine synthase B [Sulfurivirga caldicuralii]
MAKKRRGKPISGVVLVDKPAGMTSNAVVQRIKRIYDAQKAGHTGTLDPFATGLLPVCLGEATKASAFLLDADKTYEATLKLGARTDTADCEGEVIETAPLPLLTRDGIVAAMYSLTGEIEQIPPVYSALKKDGKPLYHYARKGEAVEVAPRRVQVHRFELLDFDDAHIRFRATVGKGTYIRTLGEDLAVQLGTVGHLTQLRRTETGGFKVDMALPLEVIEAFPETALLPVDRLLSHLPERLLSPEQAERFQHGNPVAASSQTVERWRVYDGEGRLLGIGVQRDGQLWPQRIFNLPSPSAG